MQTIPYNVYDYMSMQNMMSAAQDAQDGDPSDEPMQIDNIEMGEAGDDSQNLVDQLTGADDEEGEEQAEL